MTPRNLDQLLQLRYMVSNYPYACCPKGVLLVQFVVSKNSDFKFPHIKSAFFNTLVCMCMLPQTFRTCFT